MTPSEWLLAEFDAAEPPEKHYQRRPMFEVLNDHSAVVCNPYCLYASNFAGQQWAPHADNVEPLNL